MSNLNNSGKTILVVDDDPDVQSIVRMILVHSGWHVRCASNGKEARDMIAREKPELIILDLMMPVMNGFDFLALIKRDPDTNKIPIIISSAMGNDQRFIRLGADKVLPKRELIDIESLVKAVNDVMDGDKPELAVI